MPLDASTDSVARHGMREQIRKLGDKLFDRPGLLALWQELAEQFLPTRADFTVTRTMGDDLAAHLTTSFPIVAARDLSNTFSSMLRPPGQAWFKCRSGRPDREDDEAKKYLEWATGLQKNAMYDQKASFVRATKEGDADFAVFGQCVIQTEMFRPRNGTTPHLLYRNRHLRDVAWKEGVTGHVDTIYRKDKPTALDLNRLFRGRIHPRVREKLEKEPYHEVNVWHAVIPSDLYAEMPGGREIKQPWVSIFLDIDNDNHEMECVGQWTRGYTIPRWQTVSGSQYAHSAAMVAALPDARLLQAVTLVLLEAGEKAVNPPMKATEDVVRSDFASYPGGLTWVAEEYDEKAGAAIEPLYSNTTNGLQFALELVRDIRNSLKDATFLSKLDMPPVGGPEMTAYEVGQRVQEYIRNALPLFQPVEVEYNGALCDDTFELLFRNSPEMQQYLPRSLEGADRQFEFESPLKDASEKAKAGMFIESQQIIAAAAQTDPNALLLLDTMKAARDVLNSTARAAWMRPESEVEREIANRQAAAEQAKLMALMEQGVGIAKTASEAAANTSAAMPSFQLS